MSAGRRRGLRGAAAILALVAGGAAWALSGAGSDDGDWVRVTRDELVLTAEVSGVLKAERSRLIGPPGVPRVWDYKISFLAPEGSEVAEGDPVVSFDATELERMLQERTHEHEQAVERLAKAEIAQSIAKDELALQVEEAEGRLHKAQLKVEVPPELSKRLELEKSRIDLELATREVEHLSSRLDSQRRMHAAELDYLKGRVERTRERVQATQDSIEKMTVKAPVAGTVIHVQENGEKRKVGDSVWRGAKVVEIPDLTELRAEGLVDEADAGKIRVGQLVRLRLEAHPDQEYRGRVRNIRETVSRKSWRDPTKVVRLDVELDETDSRRMRPGMRFRGTIELERIPDLLLAPADSVFQSADGPVAWTRDWSGARALPLETGRHDEDRVEILSGLSDEQRILRRAPEGS